MQIFPENEKVRKKFAIAFFVSWRNAVEDEFLIINYLAMCVKTNKGSSINDVTIFWPSLGYLLYPQEMRSHICADQFLFYCIIYQLLVL